MCVREGGGHCAQRARGANLGGHQDRSGGEGGVCTARRRGEDERKETSGQKEWETAEWKPWVSRGTHGNVTRRDGRWSWGHVGMTAPVTTSNERALPPARDPGLSVAPSPQRPRQLIR